ncbi:hypothetical protein VNO78_02925 [Psophocarpus tetragonolobus]|uniref:Uncharacterized protein n=1 Tax=Psophocarpus tetragonolobus TaxID=3891 RepID=A0AAN9TBW1_PSOTE
MWASSYGDLSCGRFCMFPRKWGSAWDGGTRISYYGCHKWFCYGGSFGTGYRCCGHFGCPFHWITCLGGLGSLFSWRHSPPSGGGSRPHAFILHLFLEFLH